MSLESNAEFKARLGQYGLWECEEHMRTHGVVSMATLAFCGPYVPGGAEELFQKHIVDKFLARPVDPLKENNLRRLHFEATVEYNEGIRARQKATSDGVPQKVGPNELQSRREAAQAYLRGTELTGEKDISNRLLH